MGNASSLEVVSQAEAIAEFGSRIELELEQDCKPDSLAYIVQVQSLAQDLVKWLARSYKVARLDQYNKPNRFAVVVPTSLGNFDYSHVASRQGFGSVFEQPCCHTLLFGEAALGSVVLVAIYY